MLLHLQMRALGFAATTLLMCWGVMALAMLALGGFTFDGLMAQLENLTARYVAADSSRQLQFKEIAAAANLVVGFLVAVLRRSAMQAHGTASFANHA